MTKVDFDVLGLIFTIDNSIFLATMGTTVSQWETQRRHYRSSTTLRVTMATSQKVNNKSAICDTLLAKLSSVFVSKYHILKSWHDNKKTEMNLIG